MTDPKGPVEISGEEEVPGMGTDPPRRVRVSLRLQPPAEGSLGPADIQSAAEELKAHLATLRSALVGAGSEGLPVIPHPDRPLEELLETYRPRSEGLVDALLWEGQLTPTEHSALKEHLSRAPLPPSPKPQAPPAPSPPPPPPASRTVERPRPAGRSPEEILRQLNLRDLKDVNRARARELVTYDEWIALKKYLQERASGPSAGENRPAQ